MQLIRHNDAQTRNTWIHDHATFYTFLQSRERGDVNERLGHEVIRYDIVEAKGEERKEDTKI